MGDPFRPVVGSRVLAALFAATLLGYAMWSAFSGHGVYRSARVGFGVDSYRDVTAARAPVWSSRFYAARRVAPFPFLLLAKLCARNLRAIVLVQSVLAIAAWLFLAHSVAQLLHGHILRAAAFIAILLIAVSPTVLLWNATVSTESIATSLLAATMAILIRVVTNRGRLLWLLIALVGFGLVRDTNAYVLLGGAALAAASAFRQEWRRPAAAIAVVCLLVGAVDLALATQAQREYVPLMDVVAQRVLPSASARGYFVAHGMPLSAAVLTLETRYPADSDIVEKDAELASFRTWVLHDGSKTYERFLVSHPAWLFGKPFDARDALLAVRVLPYGRTYHDEPRGFFRVLGAVGFPGSPQLVELWIVGAIGAGLLLAKRRDDRNLLALLAAVGALSVVGFVVAWQGDSLEIDRHALSSACALRIVLWTVTLLAFDRLRASFAVTR